jgi:phage terminase large subunit
MVKAWIAERTLYVEFEAWEVGCDIDRLPALFDQVPGSRDHACRADNARPETISYLQRHGFPNMEAVEKWSGSVEDGIAHLRQYERIVIHPRCEHIIDEFRLYSYKVDRLSGDVLPDIVDAMNDGVDSLRYSLAPLIRQGDTGFLHYMEEQVAEARKRKAAEPEVHGEIAPGIQLGGAMSPAEIAAYKKRHAKPIH